MINDVPIDLRVPYTREVYLFVNKHSNSKDQKYLSDFGKQSLDCLEVYLWYFILYFKIVRTESLEFQRF